MNDIQDISVYFTDGYVISKDRVLIAAKLNSLANEDFSRVFYYFDGEWSSLDIEDTIRSVSFDKDTQECFWLGANGIVTIDRDSQIQTEKILDVEQYGNLNRIKLIGSRHYICGYGGQVYQRIQNEWVHMDDNLLVEDSGVDSVDLQDIDGTGPDDIYVVGTGGAIYHYDGNCWSQLDSPTNLHLLRVRCVGKNEVYLCGSKGIFFRGNRDGWIDCRNSEIERNFWGLEWFNNQIYLACSDYLIIWNRDNMKPIDIPTNKRISHHRLHANDGVIWSFGEDDLFCFDGNTWLEIVCPDNIL